MPTDEDLSKFLGEQNKPDTETLKHTVELQRKKISRLENRIQHLETENHRQMVKIIRLNKKLSGGPSDRSFS